MILYLHGFRSSPASAKARLMVQAMSQRGLAEQLECPQLPASPRAAIDMAMEIAQGQLRKTQASPQALTIVGSSLGGFYATWLAEQLDCKAVLLNPAVHAPRELAKHVGTHRLYHSDEPFVFLPHYADELAALQIDRITRPERYFLIAATGDEVLDWTEMRDHYPACRQRIVQGSDHGLTDFALWLPEVLEFSLSSL